MQSRLPLHPPLAHIRHCPVSLPVCWLSCVATINASRISASASSSCTWYWKQLSQFAAFFTAIQQRSLRYLSFSPLAPCVSWCLDSFFSSLSSVNSQLPKTRRRSTRVSLQIPRRHCFILTFANKQSNLKKKKKKQVDFVLFRTMHGLEHLNETFSYKTMQTDIKICASRR